MWDHPHQTWIRDTLIWHSISISLSTKDNTINRNSSNPIAIPLASIWNHSIVRVFSNRQIVVPSSSFPIRFRSSAVQCTDSRRWPSTSTAAIWRLSCAATAQAFSPPPITTTSASARPWMTSKCTCPPPSMGRTSKTVSLLVFVFVLQILWMFCLIAKVVRHEWIRFGNDHVDLIDFCFDVLNRLDSCTVISIFLSLELWNLTSYI